MRESITKRIDEICIVYFIVFHVIFSFRVENEQNIDFVGVNSPNRGDFKTSFNADIKPYFDVYLEENQ